MPTGAAGSKRRTKANALKNATTKAPRGLSAAARGWWGRLTSAFDLEDDAAQLLLESALRAFDRMNEAATAIEKYGVVVQDKFGQLKTNPATTVERDSRAAMLSALKQLNLDIIPPISPRR